MTADEDGTLTPYGATGQAWNEIVVDPRGHTFVNAAGFDLMGGEEPKAGFVWVVRPDGTSEQVADDVWFPNGMAVTADGRTLVVAESYGHCLTGFDIGDDGTLDQPARLGRSRRGQPRRHLPRCRGGRVVRRRASSALRPRGRGRRGARGRRGRPGLLRVHARRGGRPDALRRRRELGRDQRHRCRASRPVRCSPTEHRHRMRGTPELTTSPGAAPTAAAGSSSPP